MRFLLLSTLLVFFCLTLAGQDRSGQVWLDGGSGDNYSVSSARGGYFFTDRLLIGTGIEADSREFRVSPFARYYFGNTEQAWRPYGEVGLELGFENFGINQYRGALGLERRLGQSALLNLEFEYNRFERLNFDSYVLNGRLNTLLGGASGSSVAQSRFQKGNLIVNNQLFQLSFANSNDLFSTFNVELTPELGYFITDRLVGKVGLNLAYSNRDQTLGGQESSFQGIELGLTAGARYYLTKGKLFNFFVEADLTAENFSRRFDGTNDNTFQLRAELGLGASVFLNENTSIDFGVRAWQGLINTSGTSLDAFVKMNFWFGR